MSLGFTLWNMADGFVDAGVSLALARRASAVLCSAFATLCFQSCEVGVRRS